MICSSCSHDNKVAVPFCDRCGRPLFTKKKAKSLEAPKAPKASKAAKPLPVLPVFGAPQHAGPGYEIVLFTLPMPEGATKDQIVRFAELCQIPPYDARLHLNSVLPRFFGFGEESEIQSIGGKLLAAQIPVFALPVHMAFSSFQPWRVSRISISPAILLLSGEEGQLALEMNKPTFVARGRYEYSGVKKSKPKARRRSRRTGTLGVTNTNRMLHGKVTTETVEFFHVFHSDIARPVTFLASHIKDYSFLRESMTPSAQTNFKLLFDRLSALDNVTADQTLFDNALMVKDCMSEGRRGHIEQALQNTQFKRSNESMADLLARIQFFVWLSGQ